MIPIILIALAALAFFQEPTKPEPEFKPIEQRVADKDPCHYLFFGAIPAQLPQLYAQRPASGVSGRNCLSPSTFVNHKRLLRAIRFYWEKILAAYPNGSILPRWLEGAMDEILAEDEIEKERKGAKAK